MRFRRRGILVFLAGVLAACATPPPPAGPPPPPAVSPAEPVAEEASTYRSAADAPRILAAIEARRAGKPLSALSDGDLVLYGPLLLAAGRWDDAEAALSLAADRGKADAGVLYQLAVLAGARGDPKTEARRIAALEALDPGNPGAAELRAQRALAAGDRKTAAAEWTAALNRGDRASALQGLAGLALDARAPKQALSYADRAVAAAPEDDAVWALRAKVQRALGRDNAARTDLDQAVALSPENPWHRLDRGKLLWLKFGDPKAARADLEAAAASAADNVLVWGALGEVYDELDEPAKAYAAWTETLKLRPDYRFAYPSAAMLAFRYRDFAAASRWAREAAIDYPAEYAFPFVEALSLRALGQTDRSQKVLEKARPRFTRGSTVDEFFRFLLTPGSDYSFNTAMKLETQESIRIRLRYYQGCFYALTQAAHSARSCFQEAAEATLRHVPEIGAAREWMDHGS